MQITEEQKTKIERVRELVGLAGFMTAENKEELRSLGAELQAQGVKFKDL